MYSMTAGSRPVRSLTADPFLLEHRGCGFLDIAVPTAELLDELPPSLRQLLDARVIRRSAERHLLADLFDQAGPLALDFPDVGFAEGFAAEAKLLELLG